MKLFPRFLQLLTPLLLVALVWLGGQDVGGVVAGQGVNQNSNQNTNAAPPRNVWRRTVPGGARIESFTATPPRIRKGEATILRWQVKNADKLLVYPDQREDIGTAVGGPSGELRVTPERTTTYHLKVTRGSGSEIGRALVQVIEAPPPPGFCTIFGQVKDDKGSYNTIVGLYNADGSGRPLLWAKAEAGRYRIANVPEGTYRVTPKGNYPPGGGRGGGLAPIALFTQPVTCQPNGSHRADFEIRPEG